jgi:hypothetical protein
MDVDISAIALTRIVVFIRITQVITLNAYLGHNRQMVRRMLTQPLCQRNLGQLWLQVANISFSLINQMVQQLRSKNWRVYDAISHRQNHLTDKEE